MGKFLLDTDSTEEVLISLLREDNNIVVTTQCNLNCVFCSRKFNPFTTECFHKDFNFIKAQINLLRPNNLISVNSSISRLTDGEPFTHPRIWDVLNLIREKFPYTRSNRLYDKIQVTTNGTFLTEKNLKKLDSLKGIIIIHSINTTDEENWVKLTGSNDKIAKRVTDVPRLIKNYDITYIASIVALPELVGWDDLEKTIRDLDKEGVEQLRMFLPTYTKYAPKKEQDMLKCDRKKLLELVLKLRKELKIKILCYPFYSNNLTPRLEGYEPYGILPYDEIVSIDNQKIFSSWHAQLFLINKSKETRAVTIKRDNNIKNVFLKPKDIPVVSYTNLRLNRDVGFFPRDVVRVVGDRVRVLVLMSEAGSFVVRKAFGKCFEWEPVLRGKEFFFKSVRSRFYGGSVVCAGLLMCSDYEAAVEEFLKENGVRPDLILVSRESFDPLGRDLLKKSVYDLSDKIKIPIERL